MICKIHQAASKLCERRDESGSCMHSVELHDSALDSLEGHSPSAFARSASEMGSSFGGFS